MFTIKLYLKKKNTKKKSNHIRIQANKKKITTTGRTINIHTKKKTACCRPNLMATGISFTRSQFLGQDYGFQGRSIHREIKNPIGIVPIKETAIPIKKN